MPVSHDIGRVLASLLAPQQNACHLCGALLTRREYCLCEDCRQALARCAMQPMEAVSSGCPPLGYVLAAYWYEDEARELAHQLKFHHDLAAAPPLADGLCVAYGNRPASFPRPDGVVAVPLHPSRLKSRGYNQAEVLASAFCDQARLPLLSDGLIRVRGGKSQVGLSRKERLAAMAGAFQAGRRFDGMNLLLIDDVFTTGATASACGESLLAAGAKRVDLLVCCQA